MLLLLGCFGPTVPNIVHTARLEVGDAIVVCHRTAPALQAAPYTCGPTIQAVKGPTGPDVSGTEVLAAVKASGFDVVTSEVTLMKHVPRQMPDEVAEGGVVIGPTTDGSEWFGDYVYERSDGSKALFLSKTR